MKFTPADIPQAEADALIAFYWATNGPGWTNDTNWLIDPVVGNWFGVTVAGGHVTQLDVHNNALNGDGLGELAPLTSLTQIRLYTNAGLSGDIADIAALTLLTTLMMYDTGVTGDIADIAALTSLVVLRLSDTGVTGDIADIATLTLLTTLMMSDTGVTGDIADIATLTLLTTLVMNDTGLSGDIADIAALTLLTTLMMSGTSVSGDIADIAALTLLRYLYLHSTNISAGTIGTMTLMVDFRVHDCAWNQAAVDALLADMYANRMTFTFATPTLNCGGTNAAPSGIYQAACPPGTGHEYEFELENDSCGDGFNTWTITAN